MRPTVLLFDVDGTLISSGGAGRRAIERAGAAHGLAAEAFRAFAFHGMTDRGIVRQALAQAGRSGGEALIDAVLGSYLPILAEEVARAEGYRVHAGVEAVLAAALARPHTATGLGTGNIREGARVKLNHVGLFDRFAFGGFGCDHEDRDRLLAIGADRGAARLGVPRAACRVVVVGDSVRDVMAARAIGAESIVVETSGVSAAALGAAGATRVFPDLTAPGALEAVLG